jgi:hypothetical protein
VELVHDRVAAAAGDQPAVDGHGEDECDHHTSPTAQPVRQCRVAWMALRVSGSGWSCRCVDVSSSVS